MASTSGLTFKLHPLTVMNIADHHANAQIRNQSQAGNVCRVFGCVIGIQNGRKVEILNSFEILYDPRTRALDRAYLLKKLEQYTKDFPNYEILGWYSTGKNVQETDMQIHKSLMDVHENPVYVLMNPSINPYQTDLPVTIYESAYQQNLKESFLPTELTIVEGVPYLCFVKSSYVIETVKAERVALDHVAHLNPSDGGSAAAQLTTHLPVIQSAMKLMHSRMRVVYHFLLSMKKGKSQMDNSLIGHVKSLLKMLPDTDSSKSQDGFFMEFNDTFLITYLAMMTNCSSSMTDLVQ